MYRVHKTDLILLQSRGKAHEIISHAIAEDLEVEWSDIKRKLTSNYGSTRSGIEASVKISKLSMSSDELVGEYLARARTLVKSKIKNIAMWHYTIIQCQSKSLISPSKMHFELMMLTCKVFRMKLYLIANLLP